MYIDKSWIKRNFNSLNSMFFNGSLPTPKFIVNRSRDYLGQCSYEYNSDIFDNNIIHKSYSIAISNRNPRNEGDFLNTLLHEMIHLYFYSIGKLNVGHGREFQQMGRSFDKYGFNIQTCNDVCTDLHPMVWSGTKTRGKTFLEKLQVCAFRMAIAALVWAFASNEDAMKALFFFTKECTEEIWDSLCCLWVEYNMTAHCMELLHLIGELLYNIIQNITN